MKISINKDGYLMLERAGIMKPQCCPYRSIPQAVYCGDWCPLFRGTIMSEPGDGKLGVLQICDGLWHGEIIDERKPQTIKEALELGPKNACFGEGKP